MQESTIYEVQIRGTHPYPCFNNKDLAHQIAAENSMATVVTRTFEVFVDVADYKRHTSQKFLDEALNKLTPDEYSAVKRHFTQN